MRRILLFFAVLGMFASAQIASGIKQTKVAAGQTADVWLGVNVTGKVYYSIRTRDGKNQMRLWWVMQPLGRVQQLGVRANDGNIDIPSLGKGVVSAKLRGKAIADTVIYLREAVAVDGTVKFNWP
jgi:hypothetical protein